MQRLFILTIAMFVLGFDAYVVAGLLPALSATFQVGIAEIGQAVSMFTFCYAISAPVFATVLAGKSFRNILLIALIIFTMANLASAMAPDLSWFLISRAFAGVGAGLFAPVAVALVSSLVSAEHRGRTLGFLLGGMSAGTVIGVPFGLFISNIAGWESTFVLIALLSSLVIFGIYLNLPNVEITSLPSFRERISVLANKKIAATIGITLLTSVSSLGLYTYIAPVIEDSMAVYSITYLWIWGLGGIIGSFSIGYLIDYTKRPKELLLGILLIMTLAFLTLPISLSYSFLSFVPMILWGAMGWSSVAPQQHTLLALYPNQGSIVVALNSSANYLGSALGSVLGGLVIWGGMSPSKLPYAAGLIASLALVGQGMIILNFFKHKNVMVGL